MRRQDLRTLDRNLIVGVLVVFIVLSFIFLLLSWFAVIDPLTVNFRLYLWLAFGILIIIVVSVFFITKKPKIRWSKPSADIKVLEQGKYKLEKGKSYFVKEPKNDKSIDVFKEAVTKEVPALCLTRSNPKELIKKHSLEKARILWFTELEAENTINPTDLEEINYTIQQFLTKMDAGSLVLLDGVEYMISFLGFTKVLHLIQDLRDTMAMHGGVLIVPISVPTLALSSSKLFEKELEALPE